MKKWASFLWVCLILFSPGVSGAQSSKFILLDSTIGPIDSGIVDLLENEFEKETGIRVRQFSAGTGGVLEIAQQRNLD
jgi:tungstate transport system substrate-binding protein